MEFYTNILHSWETVCRCAFLDLEAGVLRNTLPPITPINQQTNS